LEICWAVMFENAKKAIKIRGSNCLVFIKFSLQICWFSKNIKKEVPGVPGTYLFYLSHHTFVAKLSGPCIAIAALTFSLFTEISEFG
jgi:hypothetical protein